MNSLRAWIRIALLDLKGDLRHFGVLLACLALGTCTIAAVGSVGGALQAAIVRDASKLMGGDLEAARSDHRASAEEIAYLRTYGQVAEIDDSNGRGDGASGDSAFLDIMAVDDNYPLLGHVVSPQLPAGQKPAELLAPKDGVYGALLDQVALDRMGIGLGGTFKIGDTEYQARGTISSLPDGAARGFHLGLLTVVSVDALANTPDARPPMPGMLTQYRYKVLLDNGMDYDQASTAILGHFNDPTHWKTRSPRDAAGNLARYYDMFTQFLTIVGLSALLVGGVGVSNAVSAYISERQRSVATMRSLGATSSRITVHFMVQLGVLSLIGVMIGVVLGAASTALALPFLGHMLGIDLPPSIDAEALLTAIGFGMLVAFGFSFLPIVRAQKLKPAMLFRSLGTSEPLEHKHTVQPLVVLPLAVTAGLIYLLAVLTTGQISLVTWYAAGVVIAFLLLRFAGVGLQLLLRLLPPLPNADIRHAFKSIVRPGSPAPIVIMSIGLGLAMLLVIALLDNNLRGQLQGEITRDAPTFIVTDLFPDEVTDLADFSKTNPNIVGFTSAPMFRGAVTEINGRPASEYKDVPEEAKFLLGGDTPMTWTGPLPPKTRVVAGEWWGPDYHGAPQISLRTSTAQALGLHVGDTITFSFYGQTVKATISNLREYEWQTGGLNFMVTFSPHALDGLPGSTLGGIKAAEGQEKAAERDLARAFPDLTFIPIGDALAKAADILDKLSAAVDIVGGLAVVNGLLVLAGTMAAGRKQREFDAVIVKVLGATRADVLRSFVFEYGLLGGFAAVLAAVIGIFAAWAITQKALEVGYAVDIPLILIVIAGTIAATIATGAATTWGALSTRPAQFLRAE
jgi:putative ABC transport system permease protein